MWDALLCLLLAALQLRITSAGFTPLTLCDLLFAEPWVGLCERRLGPFRIVYFNQKRANAAI